MKTFWKYRLAPSKIAGVGVFSTIPIIKGEEIDIFEDDFSDTMFFSNKKSKNKLYTDFCDWFGVQTKNGFYTPLNPHHIHIGWFVNHSVNPNCYSPDAVHYYALKNIKRGEELTIDYKNLDKDIDNSKL